MRTTLRALAGVAVAAIALLGAVACGQTDDGAGTGGGASGSPTPSAAASPSSGSGSIAITGTASDRHFTYTVSKMECRASLTKDGKTTEPTEGQYCLVYLSVKNTTAEETWFYLNDQFAYDAAGTKYDHDGFDAKYLDKFVTQSQLGAGGQGDYVLLFDIAPSVKLTGLELHETDDTPGVKLDFR